MAVGGLVYLGRFIINCNLLKIICDSRSAGCSIYENTKNTKKKKELTSITVIALLSLVFFIKKKSIKKLFTQWAVQQFPIPIPTFIRFWSTQNKSTRFNSRVVNVKEVRHA